MEGTEAGAQLGGDWLDRQAFFVQLNRSSALRLRQRLATHPNTAVIPRVLNWDTPRRPKARIPEK